MTTGDDLKREAGASHSLSALDRIRARTLDSLTVKALPPPDWQVRDVLVKGSFAVLYGPSGAGKSFAAIGIALGVATGTEWLGHDVHRGPVLYVVGEGAGALGRRIDAWEQHSTMSATDVYWHLGAVNLFNAAEASALTTVVAERNVELVIFDTWARCTVGAEENSAKDVGQIVAAIDRLREETGTTVLVPHHAGKDASRGARGSSALKAAADTEIEMGDPYTLKITKQKDGPDGLVIPIKRLSVAESCVLVPGAVTFDDEGMAALKTFDVLKEMSGTDDEQGIASGQWQRAVGVAERTFYNHRKRLLERGFVENIGTAKQPRYRPKDVE